MQNQIISELMDGTRDDRDLGVFNLKLMEDLNDVAENMTTQKNVAKTVTLNAEVINNVSI